MPKPQTVAGIVITAIGLVAIFISWQIQTSDVDPRALTVAFIGIAVAIVGLSLIIGDPNPRKQTYKDPLLRETTRESSR